MCFCGGVLIHLKANLSIFRAESDYPTQLQEIVRFSDGQHRHILDGCDEFPDSSALIRADEKQLTPFAVLTLPNVTDLYGFAGYSLSLQHSLEVASERILSRDTED